MVNENQESEIDEPSNSSAEATDLENLRQERNGLYDRLLRKQAEFDNFKKRVERGHG